MQFPEEFSAALRDYPWLRAVIQLAALLLATWLSNLLAQSLLVRAIRRALRTLPDYWYEALVGNRVFRKLAHAAPALVIRYGIALIDGVPADIRVGVGQDHPGLREFIERREQDLDALLRVDPAQRFRMVGDDE